MDGTAVKMTSPCVHTTQEEINKKGLPRRNERDIKDVPEELRKQLTFVLVDDAEEVLRHALTPPAAGVPRGAR